MIEVIGFVATFLMGIILGLIGGGGSILTVPILVYLFSLSPIEATSYSLFIVALTALLGGVYSYKNGEINFKIGFLFALPSFLGIYLVRVYLLPNLPDVILETGLLTLTKSFLIMLVFAALMIIASLSMMKNKTEKKATRKFSTVVSSLLIAIEGVVVGGVTGFVGAGGGFLIIPALVVLIGLPMKQAVGTSLMIITLKSFIGVFGDLQAGLSFDWRFLIVMSLLGCFGMIVGKLLTQRISDKGLKKFFGQFVLIMGSLILLEQISREFFG